MRHVQHARYFQVIEYILFFGLSGLSVIFMHGVLIKFFSGKTSFSQSEESVKALPTIVICLNKQNSSKIEYEYGSDLQILYEIGHKNGKGEGILLTEGENSTHLKSSLLEENVFLEKIITVYNRQCYKLTSVLTNNYMIKQSTDTVNSLIEALV